MAAGTTAGLSGRGWSLATATVGKIIQGQEAYGETPWPSPSSSASHWLRPA